MTRRDQAEGEALAARRCPIDLAAEAEKARAELAAERRTISKTERGLIIVAVAILALAIAVVLGGVS